MAEVHKTLRIDEAIPFIPPVDPQSLPKLDRESYASASSIGKTTRAASPYEPSKPILEKPSPIWETIHQVVGRHEPLADRHSRSKEAEINRDFGKVQKLQREEAQKLEESYAASRDVTFWGILQDIGSGVMSAVSFFTGFSALSTNPAVGGMLIISGVLSLSNLALKHAQVWDWVADQVAQDNETLHYAITTYIPSAIGITAAALGAYGAYSTWNYSHLSKSEQALSIIQTMGNIGTGMAALANGKAQSFYTWTGAQLSELQFMIELTKMDLETVVEDMKTFHKKLSETIELAAKLLEETDQAIQITQQTV